MLHVRPNLRAGASAADAAAMLVAHPATAQVLADLQGPNRSRVRRLLAEYYGSPVADMLVPAGTGGRPREYTGPWSMLSAPTRADISDVLGGPLDESTAADWTPAMMVAAADAISRRYTNPTSAAMGLKSLRIGLQAIGVDKAALVHTARPDVIRRHNDKIQLRTAERIAEGIDVPPPYARVADLVQRVETFVAGAPVDAQSAADFLVVFSARPGEADTIDIGPGGGVIGALKKRGAQAEYPIVSAIGTPLATAFISAWKKAPLAARRKALAALPALVASWGIQKRDLRAIGASLAVRAAIISGDAGNEGQQRDKHRAALRHEEPKGRAAQDHYQRVNDPVAELCAGVAELSEANRAALVAFMEKLRA